MYRGMQVGVHPAGSKEKLIAVADDPRILRRLDERQLPRGYATFFLAEDAGSTLVHTKDSRGRSYSVRVQVDC